ncbi:PstS family phosphate ABC transporter substrate-binding protein [Planktothrix sp. FACHB-1355]|uniref:Phosphate-binding protein n=1 Tax=Aerosakkonema funiforme FACHB-1375 TaxID=2949571 RepID=A0A926VL46_9CYAN|nr:MULTISPECIES: PstS family phosphate ABC transporter substrate-binding protein [Oscillatoriales]MBD2185749.1 PstS family phosphate ABC transporter substrate-binding protein [Aerosakkonema funiforme FACHB-1375]MBD3560635.1 PstS family phosphate ABC transporter substrate-binding protein [Planktothrix sp. FACHB-1355]
MVVHKRKFKLNRFTTIAAMAVAATTIGVSVSSVKSQSPALIKIDGSSTVYPVTAAVAEEFQRSKGNAVRVTVGISGTGGGFKKFCRGETDVSNASRPILAEELQACRAAGVQFIELPVAYDALTVVVNPQNNWATNISVAELKKMWEPASQGSVTKWNQVRQGWPNAPLKLFGPGADSGTFDYFTEAVVGKSKSSRGDYTASEDDNVLVQGVSRDRSALGYFGYAYYEANRSRLKAVAVNGVLPSRQTVENGSYKPLSRPIFIYVNAKAAQRGEVRDFVSFYMSNAPRLVPAVKYVPLPAQAYTIASQHFQNRKLGTVFAGDAPVGLTIQQLLQREARQ